MQLLAAPMQIFKKEIRSYITLSLSKVEKGMEIAKPR